MPEAVPRFSYIKAPSGGNDFLADLDEAYFRTHETFAPVINPGEPAESVEARIAELKRLASETRNQDDSIKFINEASYLRDRLNRGI